MIVKKAIKLLVEIKTGKQTEKSIPPQVRRQLLEYYLVFKPDGVIYQIWKSVNYIMSVSI